MNSPVLWGHLTQTDDLIQDFVFCLFKEFILQKSQNMFNISITEMVKAFENSKIEQTLV